MRRPFVAAALAACVIAPGVDAARPPPAVEASAPRAVGLGDVFDYVVEATVPSSESEAAELTADTGPFTVLDAEPIERAMQGGVTVIRLVRRLGCLDEGCVGRDRSLRIVLPAPVLVVASRTITGRAAAVTVRGRIAPSSARPDPSLLRADTTIPAATGTSPTTLVTALAATAVVALLLALTLVASTLRRRDSFDDPLARAIRLVRESAGRPEADRRRAADLLARTAGDRDHAPLVADATRIAWAQSPPTPDRVEQLAANAARETA